MNHQNGDMGSGGEHWALAIVEVNIKVRADPAQALIFCHDAGAYRQISTTWEPGADEMTSRPVATDSRWRDRRAEETRRDIM